MSLIKHVYSVQLDKRMYKVINAPCKISTRVMENIAQHGQISTCLDY